ncbi:hypothetical protein [Pseudomonas aeruginosa]|uniref:hypothetical protein n=1 Tax=Pseudomonas aeruginosa TaxID=287 RepID=UPI00126A13D3|nr:hypothetical protein [Pseudomonas aeruginosa]
MDLQHANQTAARYYEHLGNFYDLQAHLAPFFAGTVVGEIMNAISDCIEEAELANTQCGFLPEGHAFDEQEWLASQIRRDGKRRHFRSLQDIPEHLREHFGDDDQDFRQYADQLRDECYEGYNLLIEQQSILEEHLESQHLQEIYDYVDVEGLPLHAKDAICQVFEHMLALWGKYETQARSLTKMAHLVDENDPDPDLTKAALFD